SGNLNLVFGFLLILIERSFDDRLVRGSMEANLGPFDNPGLGQARGEGLNQGVLLILLQIRFGVGRSLELNLDVSQGRWRDDLDPAPSGRVVACGDIELEWAAHRFETAMENPLVIWA